MSLTILVALWFPTIAPSPIPALVMDSKSDQEDDVVMPEVTLWSCDMTMACNESLKAAKDVTTVIPMTG